MALNKIDIGNCMMACAHETLFGAGAVIGAAAAVPPPADATR